MRRSFDGFEIDVDARRLFVAGQDVPLEPRAIEMLCYLASHPGRLVTKDELLTEVWRARSLSDGVLANTAAKLRKALGQAAGTREPIETVRGRGFRWHAARASGAAGTDASGAATRTEPFIGRVHVLSILERALDQAAAGAGQTLMFAGAAGMGKTRTLDELAKRARARGFSVWQGAAYDGAGAPPYWPWIQVLRSAHGDLSRAVFQRHLAPGTWAMALLVPELVAAAPQTAAADSQAPRFRLFDEVVRFIASACVDAPRLILADDLHWADDETIELFARASRALQKHRVVLAVTLRDQDITESSPRADALRRLVRGATRVALTGLSALEVGELVAAFDAARTPDARVSALLHERTHGNPFFVRQTLELLAERGLALDGPSLERLPLPEAVRGVLRERLLALDEHTSRVLRLAAAVGVDFDAGVLAEVLDVSEADVLAALEPARRAGVVVPHSAVARRFSFEHALLRESMYESLELAERGDYHARLARVLERRSVTGDPRGLGEIARHFLVAVPSDLQACERHCRQAAAAARDALGFAAAADLLSRMCEKLAREGGDERTHCELLMSLGADHFCAGDVASAWRALREAAVSSERIGATELFARGAAYLASWLDLGGGDEVETRQLVDRALIAIGHRDPDARAVLLASSAVMRHELANDARRALLDEADTLAARQSSPETVLRVVVSRASLRDPTRVDESRAATARYRSLARQYAHLRTPYWNLQDFAVELTDYLAAITACELDVADAAIERCRWLAERSQLRTVALTVELMEAARALGDGRLDDLAATLQRVKESGDVMVGGLGLVWTNYELRLLEARGGLALLAGVDLEADVSRFDELRPNQRMNGMFGLAAFAMKLGQHDKSRRFLARVDEQELARLPVRYGDLGLLCLLAEMYETSRDIAGAEALYARMLPYEERNGVLPAFDYCGAVAHYLGLLAQLLGHPERALRHFERAEAINHRLRMPRQQSESRARAAAVRRSAAMD